MNSYCARKTVRWVVVFYDVDECFECTSGGGRRGVVSKCLGLWLFGSVPPLSLFLNLGQDHRVCLLDSSGILAYKSLPPATPVRTTTPNSRVIRCNLLRC